MDILDFGSFIKQHNLCVFNIDGWSLIQRATFDIQVEEYPYHSIQIYVNLKSNKYNVRVLGRSVRSGKVDKAEDLRDLCTYFFRDHLLTMSANNLDFQPFPLSLCTNCYDNITIS